MQKSRASSSLSSVFRPVLVLALASLGCDLAIDGDDALSSEASSLSIEDDAPFLLTLGMPNRTTFPGGGTLFWDMRMVNQDGNPGAVRLSMTASDPPFSGRAIFIWNDVVRPGDTFRWVIPAPACDVTLGDHELTFTGTRDDGATASVSGTVTVLMGAQPRASFLVSQQGLSFQFTENSVIVPCQFDLEVVSWTWSFGDGTGSIEQHPSHTYAKPGDYWVSLVVTTPTGERHDTQWRVTATRP
jgi:hypothetical protein